ncbi:MAG: hypothetical protein K2L72_02545 [Clostridia bacterium]|nr:hypothetical protein [Clostridia bacterium]
MKKIILAVVVIMLAVAGALHTTYCYFRIENDEFTGVPATTSLLLLIPYALAIAVCLLVGLIICRKKGG